LTWQTICCPAGGQLAQQARNCSAQSSITVCGIDVCSIWLAQHKRIIDRPRGGQKSIFHPRRAAGPIPKKKLRHRKRAGAVNLRKIDRHNGATIQSAASVPTIRCALGDQVGERIAAHLVAARLRQLHRSSDMAQRESAFGYRG
jgi:hypothetical protein